VVAWCWEGTAEPTVLRCPGLGLGDAVARCLAELGSEPGVVAVAIDPGLSGLDQRAVQDEVRDAVGNASIFLLDRPYAERDGSVPAVVAAREGRAFAHRRRDARRSVGEQAPESPEDDPGR